MIDHEAKTRPQRYICILIEDFVKFAPIFEVEQLVRLPDLYTSQQIEVFLERFLQVLEIVIKVHYKGLRLLFLRFLLFSDC